MFRGRNKTPDVSVIIAVRNGAHEIRGCVESVLGSRFPREKMELICVDNASTDNTLSVLQSFGSAIQVIQESKRGAGAARNAGIRQASGTFVAFTDADCNVHPDWLANLLNPLRSDQACAVGGKILARPQAGFVERFGELIHDHRQAIQVYRPPYIISMNLASRRDLLLSMGGFDERWIRMQDVDLSFRLLAAERRLGYCDDAIVYHHNRDTIPKLLREGFTHGYWGAAFLETYGAFILEYQRKTRQMDPARAVVWPYHPGPLTPKPPQAAKPSGSKLNPTYAALLSKLFKWGKQAGRMKGRWFPLVVIERGEGQRLGGQLTPALPPLIGSHASSLTCRSEA